MDLSPRTITEIDPAAPTDTPKRKRPWPAIVMLVLVLVAGGFAVTKFLSSAIDYYCNVDEIGRKSGCDVGRDLRIQGTVDEGSLTQEANGVTVFTISFNGVKMPVRYTGSEVALFQECIPVVISGKVVTTDAGGELFEGTAIEVKHSNEYEAEHPDRVDAATGKAESAACSQARA